jgi:hypothetical protein
MLTTEKNSLNSLSDLERTSYFDDEKPKDLMSLLQEERLRGPEDYDR